MTTGETHDLVALYVVDALSAEEAQEFESHLEGCAECRKEVAEMRTVTEMLSSSVDADPPSALRGSILAEIAVTAQEPGDRRSVGPAPAADDAARAERVAVPDNVIPLRRNLGSRLAYLVAAASVLLAVGFGGWALQSRDDAHQASGQQAQLLDLLGAGDVRTVSGTATPGGSGTVVLSRDRAEAVFVATDLPDLPDGKVYELWTVTDKAVPAGTFDPDDDALLVTLPNAALSAAKVAVTVEPQGGSQQPTTQPILAVPIPTT
jgi:anti-sigma-K factor RskA